MKKTLVILFFWLVDVLLCLLAAFLVVWVGIEFVSSVFCIFR